MSKNARNSKIKCQFGVEKQTSPKGSLINPVRQLADRAGAALG